MSAGYVFLLLMCVCDFS